MALTQLVSNGKGQEQGLELKSIDYCDIPFNQNDLKYSCNINKYGDLSKI